MIKILDPVSYTYNQQEWESRQFVDRLEDLTTFLIKVEEFEELVERSDRLIRFQAAAEALENIYEENPFINSPVIPNYYQMQFGSAILPRLLRRFDVCGERACDLKDEIDILPLGIADAIAERFVASLAPCAMCRKSSTRFLYRHRDKCSISDARGFFSGEVDIGTDEYLSHVDFAELFPREGARSSKSRLLSEAVAGLFKLKIATDMAWRGKRLGNIHFHDEFWPSVERSDFGDCAREYGERIISSILQAACGYDVNIFDHRMEAWSVRHSNQNHGVWNAYVFRSGPSDRDRRCSRLYYAKIDGGILLYRYEPDAH